MNCIFADGLLYWNHMNYGIRHSRGFGMRTGLIVC